MRRLILLLLGSLALAGTAAAETPALGPRMPASLPKPFGERPAPVLPRIQGDTFDDPFTIPAVPFTDANNTCNFNDDYDDG